MDSMTNNKAQKNRKGQFAVTVIILLLGFAGLAEQSILIREVLTLFTGNELVIGISLGFWLLWTGIGSIGGRSIISRRQITASQLCWLLIIQSLTIPILLIVSRHFPLMLNSNPGQLLGVREMLLIIPSLFLVPCILLGFLFVFASVIVRSFSNNMNVHPISTVYIFESFGAAIGGLFVTLELIHSVHNLEIAFHIIAILAFLLSIVLFLLVQTSHCLNCLRMGCLLLMSILIPVSGTFITQMNFWSYRLLHPQETVIEIEETPHNQLILCQRGSQLSLYANGTLSSTHPNQEIAELRVYLPLLQHENPKTLLMIGGGTDGSLNELLKKADIEIDYLELDAQVTKMIQKQRPLLIPESSRLNYIIDDGRRYLAHCNRQYDIIILALGDPHNAQINRYYTVEFFRLCAEKLNQGGILAFSVSGYEDMITKIQKQYIMCLSKTLKPAFKHQVILPSAIMYFFASQDDAYLTKSIEVLAERFKNRGAGSVVNDLYVRYRFPQSRVDELQQVIATDISDIALNSDTNPRSYFYDIVLWTSTFASTTTQIFVWLDHWLNRYNFIILLTIISTIAVFPCKSRRSQLLIASQLIMFMGFTFIGLEFIQIMSYQARIGIVYTRLSLLLSVFMVGLGVGSLIMSSNIDQLGTSTRPIMITLSMIVILATVTHYLLIIPISSELLLEGIFYIIIGISGFIEGILFALVLKFHEQIKMVSVANRAGYVYGLDLIGSSIGAILISVIIVPLMGIGVVTIAISAISVVFLIVFHQIDRTVQHARNHT